jgi:hypothetical protein
LTEPTTGRDDERGSGSTDARGPSGLWDAARTLGAGRFRVLWLRYGEDMSIEEIAAVTGRTRLAVRVLLHRARTSLAGRLGPDQRPTARMAAEDQAKGESRCDARSAVG